MLAKTAPAQHAKNILPQIFSCLKSTIKNHIKFLNNRLHLSFTLNHAVLWTAQYLPHCLSAMKFLLFTALSITLTTATVLPVAGFNTRDNTNPLIDILEYCNNIGGKAGEQIKYAVDILLSMNSKPNRLRARIERGALIPDLDFEKLEDSIISPGAEKSSKNPRDEDGISSAIETTINRRGYSGCVCYLES